MRDAARTLAIPLVAALLLLPVLAITRNQRLLVGEALIVSGLVVVGLLGVALQLRPFEPSPVDEAHAGEDARPSRPADLERIERQLALPAVRRNELDDRARTLLRSVLLRRMRLRSTDAAALAPPLRVLLVERGDDEAWEPLGTAEILELTDRLEEL
jgi:hypothetical protein